MLMHGLGCPEIEAHLAALLRPFQSISLGRTDKARGMTVEASCWLPPQTFSWNRFLYYVFAVLLHATCVNG